MIQELELKQIRTDGDTQQRPIDEGTIKKYKALMEDGVEFPPIDVAFDGKDYWLFNGFHRYHCYRQLNRTVIMSDVNDATLRDAIWFSYAANKDHGLPRQSGAINDIIRKILADKDWAKYSLREVACWVGVSEGHVRAVRDKIKSKENADKSATSEENGDSEQLQQSQITTTVERGDQVKTENNSQDQQEMVDSVGEVIPEHLQEVFLKVNEFSEIINQMNAILRTAKKHMENEDIAWAFISMSSLQEAVNSVKRNLKFAMPYAVCRYCGGDGEEGNCKPCRGTGFVNERIYMATLEEMKKK